MSPAQKYDAFINQSSLVALGGFLQNHRMNLPGTPGPWNRQGPLSLPRTTFSFAIIRGDNIRSSQLWATSASNQNRNAISRLQMRAQINQTQYEDAQQVQGTDQPDPIGSRSVYKGTSQHSAVTVSEVHCPALESATRDSRAVSCIESNVPMPLGGLGSWWGLRTRAQAPSRSVCVAAAATAASALGLGQ